MILEMTPDVYQEWQAMSQEKQNIALDAIERAILEAMERLEARIEAEHAAKQASSLFSDEPPSQSLKK